MPGEPTPSFGLALLARESRALSIEISNVPPLARALRLLVINNSTDDNEMRKYNVPMPVGLSINCVFRIPDLVNGNKYDFVLSAYDRDFALLGSSVRLLDQIPASPPQAPVVGAIANRDGGLYRISFDCGPDVGDDLQKLVVNLYRKDIDELRTEIFDIFGKVANDRSVTVEIPGLVVGKIFKFTAYTTNALGDSELSSGRSLLITDVPDRVDLVHLILAENKLRAEWFSKPDVESFENVKYEVSYFLQWIHPDLGRQESVFDMQEISALSYLVPAAVNFHERQFNSSDVAQLVSRLNLQDIRQLSVKCRVQTKVGSSLRSLDSRESAVSIDLLNVPDEVASRVSSFINVDGRLSRASANGAATLSLSGVKSSANKAAIDLLARVNPSVNAIDRSNWFDRMVIVAKYMQSNADAAPVESDLVLELVNSQLRNNQQVELNENIYRPSDSLKLFYYLQNGVGGAKSVLFPLPDQFPTLASLLDPDYEEDGMSKPVCRNGKIYVKVKILRGNALSAYGVVNLKIDGALPGTAFDSPLIALALPLRDEPNVFEMECGFGVIPQGSFVNVKFNLFEIFSGSSVPSLFHSRDRSSDTLAFFDPNFTDLIAQGPDSVVSMVADLTLDPQGAHNYALFLGFAKKAFAKAQGSNMDLNPPVEALGSEVLMTLDAGVAPKAVNFNLDMDSDTYLRHYNDDKLSLLPVGLKVALNGFDSLSLVEVDNADLISVKNRSSFAGLLSNYHWLRCMKASLAPGENVFNVLASRSIRGVTYSSMSTLSAMLVDAASIVAANVEATKKAVAIPFIFNNGASVELLITGVPLFDPMNNANSVVSVRRSAVTAADLVRGYYLVRVEKECSAFLIAAHTNGASGTSLICLVVNADQAVDVKPNIPALV